LLLMSLMGLTPGLLIIWYVLSYFFA
jgi:hypothetical protein